MNALTEMFPLLCGVLVGLVCIALRAKRQWFAIWLLLSLVLGLHATWLSGEYLESWAYAMVDSTWVAGVSLAVQLAYQAYRKQSLPLG